MTKLQDYNRIIPKILKSVCCYNRYFRKCQENWPDLIFLSENFSGAAEKMAAGFIH